MCVCVCFLSIIVNNLYLIQKGEKKRKEKDMFCSVYEFNLFMMLTTISSFYVPAWP